MRYKSIFFLLIIVSFSSSGQKDIESLLRNHNRGSLPYVSAEEARMLQLSASAVILDARELEEFEISHIPAALHIGFDTFSSEEKQLRSLPKNLLVIVYCSVGIRSEQIGDELKKMGFSNVKNLYGGIFEWKNKGFPVLDQSGSETENVHTFSKMWSSYLHSGNPIY